ncbi:hypothetical protein [Bacillus sp. S/N-304-OC-R1]|uniref:hypothetical protein n=1 Tax=Bacillus sp. S/N-304-OC-R1 TaxID=2758034 RepID=UPI001C8CF4C2|nr:hypothetical protein [Bacillus sp. S/N-304-OC-R1]MBY0124494.1 hypothetical protein [Bacillus sp. S/N-304-OC-R1]
MVVRSRDFLGRKVIWDDGLFDITQSQEFYKVVMDGIEYINNVIAEEHRTEHFKNLQEVVERNTKYWMEQMNKTKVEAQQQIDAHKQEISNINKKYTRDLTADEVGVLSYQANKLKSKISLLSSPHELPAFLDELMESSYQVKKAFLDNAPDILKTADEKISIDDIKSIMKKFERSLMSDADVQAVDEINLKVKNLEYEKNSGIGKRLAIEKTINDLKSKVSWEQIMQNGDGNFGG